MNNIPIGAIINIAKINVTKMINTGLKIVFVVTLLIFEHHLSIYAPKIATTNIGMISPLKLIFHG